MNDCKEQIAVAPAISARDHSTTSTKIKLRNLVAAGLARRIAASRRQHRYSALVSVSGVASAGSSGESGTVELISTGSLDSASGAVSTAAGSSPPPSFTTFTLIVGVTSRWSLMTTST